MIFNEKLRALHMIILFKNIIICNIENTEFRKFTKYYTYNLNSMSTKSSIKIPQICI